MRRLIRWSGGYPRELVRLLQTVWTHERALSESDLGRICSEVTDSYRKIVRGEDADWLARVAEQHYVATVNDEEQKIADRMLSSNAVLRYLNGEDWFDLHPAVHEVPVVQAVLAARRVQAKQP
ncbi:MAG: hypothetical protein JW940_06340 [Polyangiaceae bacterium]|nr:hypothetical protein [Polyangiaceae bacterium]